jgi:RNA polymerase sigma-70 factor (ECF subfamily)
VPKRYQRQSARIAVVIVLKQDHRQDEPSTSESLLQSARRGDADGWRSLAQIYGPIIYAWARKCGCQSADAADVMQETLASVTSALSRFDHDQPGATFRGWLWTITRNKLRDRARGENELATGGTEANLRLQQVADRAIDPDQGSMESSEPPSELASDLASARSRTLALLRDHFDPRSWKMFWETAVQGRQPADVADEMGVSRWAVYKARARVLQRLQQQMTGIE